MSAPAVEISPSPTVSPSPPVKSAYFTPIQSSSICSLLIKKMVELSIQIIIPLGVILFSYALLPLSFSAVALPLIAFCAIFSSAFMFATDPTPEVSKRILAPPAIENPPKGIFNTGSNCWLNSLLQVFRCDRQLMQEIQQAPEPIDIDSATAMTTMPLDLLFSPEEREFASLQEVPFNRLLPRSPHSSKSRELPPEIQAAQIEQNIKNFIRELAKLPEVDLIPVELIFSNIPVVNRDQPNGIIENFPLGTFDHFSVVERAGRLRNAARLITGIRQFSQTLTDLQKQDILNRIDKIQHGFRLLRDLRELKLLKLPLEYATDPFSEEREQAFTALLAELYEGDSEKVELVNRAKDTILAFQQDFQYFDELDRSIFCTFFSTARTFADMSIEERFSRLHCFTRFNGSVSDANFFAAFKSFFTSYEQGISDANSVRLALHTRFPESIPHGRQLDPAEVFNMLTSMLPSRFDVQQRIRRTYLVGDYPLANSVEGTGNTKDEFQPNKGVLELDIIKESPNLVDMLQQYTEKSAENDEPISLTDMNGVRRKYSLTTEQHHFDTGPSSLWITIKRFESAIPWNFFHMILPCCCPKPASQSMKLKTPIELPDFLELMTIREGIVRYKLDAFIVHVGDSIHNGHYISYKLEQSATGEEVWYEMNDSTVCQIEGEALATARSQVFFPHYSRVSASPSNSP